MTATSWSSADATTCGSSGRAVAQPMEAELLEALQQHLNMERSASVAYLALAIWFAERELRGFSQFFKQEAQDEQLHAARFVDYLIARGQSPRLQDLPAPRQSWSSPEEILAAAFQMEADVSSSLHQIYRLAERASDLRSTTFLDPIIDAQVGAEHTFSHLLGRVRFAQGQPPALLILDGELSEGKHLPVTLA